MENLPPIKNNVRGILFYKREKRADFMILVAFCHKNFLRKFSAEEAGELNDPLHQEGSRTGEA